MAMVMAHPPGLDDPSEERISQDGIFFMQRGKCGPAWRLPPDIERRQLPLFEIAGIGVVGFE
jgi:hypothetical protein